MERYFKTCNVLEYLEESAERFPDKTAFLDEFDSMTFVQFRDAAMQVGSGCTAVGICSTAVAGNMRRNTISIYTT